MPAHADRLLRCVRRMTCHAGPASDDAGLLTRFLVVRDSTAFDALVTRHGPMVLRVCQHMLGNRHDAEDAFRAAAEQRRTVLRQLTRQSRVDLIEVSTDGGHLDALIVELKAAGFELHPVDIR